MSKISIRFYKDHKVRAVWDEANNQWWFSVLDIVGLSISKMTTKRTATTGSI